MKYKLGDVIQIDSKYPELGGAIGVITQDLFYGEIFNRGSNGVIYYSVFMNDRHYWVREGMFMIADLTPFQKVFYEF